MTITNRRSIYMVLLSLFLVLCTLFTSCISKPENIEELLNSNPDIQEEIQTAAENAGMSVEIKGNEIIYAYDLSSLEGATEEALKDEAMIKNLQSELDSQKDQFVEVCKALEAETEISGVSATVSYTYKDEALVTQTFTSAG